LNDKSQGTQKENIEHTHTPPHKVSFSLFSLTREKAEMRHGDREQQGEEHQGCPQHVAKHAPRPPVSAWLPMPGLHLVVYCCYFYMCFLNFYFYASFWTTTAFIYFPDDCFLNSSRVSRSTVRSSTLVASAFDKDLV
jgi:hypothetical protein